MQRNEKWLDDMQVKLSDVCKAYDWDLKQTSALAVGTRSFVVKHGSKSITVLISNLICTRIEADVILEYDDIEYDEDQIRTLLARKLLLSGLHRAGSPGSARIVLSLNLENISRLNWQMLQRDREKGWRGFLTK